MKESCPVCGIRHRSRTADECADRQMTEAQLQSRVIGRAKTRGWFAHHVGKGIATFDSNGNPVYVSTGSPGWPDLVLFNPHKPGPKVVAMELKREEGEVSDDQWTWLARFNACLIPAIVVRPSDLRLGRVNMVLDGK